MSVKEAMMEKKMNRIASAKPLSTEVHSSKWEPRTLAWASVRSVVEESVRPRKSSAKAPVRRDHSFRLGETQKELYQAAGLRHFRVDQREARSDIESHYKRLLESVTSYVYTVTLDDGHVVSTVHRPGCQAVTGYAPADFAADPYLWYQLVHPEDRPKVIEMAQRILTGARNLSLVHRIRHKDGFFRWVRNLLVPHFDGTGRLVSYDGIINDITERKELEESLLSSERNHRLIMESSHDIIFSLDRNFRLLAGNSAFRGMVAAVFPGREISVGEALPIGGFPDRLQCQLRSYHERALSGERFETVFSLRLPDGLHDMEGVFNPITSGEGVVEGVAVYIRDETERTRSDKAIGAIVKCMARTTGLESFDAMAESLVAWLGADGIVIGEFVGESPKIKIHCARLGGGKVSTPYTIACEPCRRIVGKEFCFHPKHGPVIIPDDVGASTLCLDCHMGVPIRNTHGDTVGILCVISHRPFKPTPRALEILTVMASKAGAEFERFRNENALRGQCSVSDAVAMDTEGFASYVDRLCHYLVIAYCPVDGRIRIDNRVSALDIGFDRAFLCGLIINELVSNALKYAFPGQRSGTISVELEREGEGSLRLRVADDGIGLPAGFNPDKAESPGMVLASRLSRRLGGSLTLVRDNGAAFVVRFPATAMEITV
jgi:PAS domain S-box-containing protein